MNMMNSLIDYNKTYKNKEMCDILGIKYDSHNPKRSLEEIERSYELKKISSQKYKFVKELSEDDKIKKTKSYRNKTMERFNINPIYKNKSGIYKIQLENTIYIGQTNNFIERYYQHNSKLNRMNKSTKTLLDNGALMEVIEFEDDLEKRLLKESKYAIEYKLMGFNVINNFNKIVKENYSKNNKEKFVIIKLKLKDLDFALKLLCDNNIFVERKTKKNE